MTMTRAVFFLALQIAGPHRDVAITFDDLPGNTTQLGTSIASRVMSDLVAVLVKQQVPAIGFVNEGKLYIDGRLDTARVGLLEQWLNAGLDLGNHTFSHKSLNQGSLRDFEHDVLLGETVTRPLMVKHGRELRFFRHPFLHTGGSVARKRAFDQFLARHGYTIAPVTIDNYDYAFARVYDSVLARGDTTAARSVSHDYISYMDTVFGFYEAQSRRIVRHDFPQILLLHANRLNADSFDALATMMRRRGYAFISLARALAHAAYHRHVDRYTGPAGISWLHRWALSDGLPASVFAGEPDVPSFVAPYK